MGATLRKMKEEEMKSEDFITSDYVRHTMHAPKIQFSEEWHKKPASDRIEYLIKLASSLNDAARMIQEERDKLNSTCIKQEKQIKSLRDTTRKDRMMIHKQLAAENTIKEKLVQENMRANREINDLQDRLKELAKDGD